MGSLQTFLIRAMILQQASRQAEALYLNYNRRTANVACYGHTIQNNPALVRSRKVNWIGTDQYYVG